MIYLVILSAVIFFSYLVYVVSKVGVINTISDSYYKVGKEALFTLVMFGTAIPIIIAGESPIMFYAGGLIAGVGAAPAFKKELEGKVHVIGAVGGIILAMLSLILEFNLWWLVLIYASLVGLLTFFRINNRTWWIEVLAFVVVLTGLMIRL